MNESICPGCRVRLPRQTNSAYDGYYNCSPECWSVYSEVLGFEFSNVIAFTQVHQLTVDCYALQHAGGRHPDKSVAVHLAGLHAAMILGMGQRAIPGLLQQLATHHDDFPHFDPPKWMGPLSVFDIALATSVTEHVARIRKWAGFIWKAWSKHHDQIAEFVACTRSAKPNRLAAN